MFWEPVSHFNMKKVFAIAGIPIAKIKQSWDCLHNGSFNAGKIVFMLKWPQSLQMAHKKPIPASRNSQKSSTANNPIWKTIKSCGITLHISTQWTQILQFWKGIWYSCYEYLNINHGDAEFILGKTKIYMYMCAFSDTLRWQK